MGTFLAIGFVLVGAWFIKSIIRDVQRDERRQARAAERRRRVKARAAAARPPAVPVQPPAPTTAADGECLIDNIGEAIVDGMVNTDIDVSQSGVYRAVARSEIRQVPDVDTNHQPAADHGADDDTDSSDSSNSGSGWSWDDD